MPDLVRLGFAVVVLPTASATNCFWARSSASATGPSRRRVLGRHRRLFPPDGVGGRRLVVGDDVPIALVGLGGVLFIGGRLSGSTGRGSDEAA